MRPERTRARGTGSPVRGFLLRFAALLVLFGVVLLTAEDALIPAQIAVAHGLQASLTLLGWSGIARDDVVVLYPNGALVIGAECTGASLIALLAAFLLAYPAGWRVRARGIAIGALVLLLANFARVLTCALVLFYRPAWFELVHEFAWRIALVGMTLVLAAWCVRPAERRRPASPC